MFKDSKALKDIRQGWKHPLPIIIDSPRGNDEQCECNGQYVQHIVPFSYMEPQGTSDCRTALFAHITAIKKCNSNAKYNHENTTAYMLGIIQTTDLISP